MIQEKREKNILLLSFVSGLVFAIVELIFAIFSHSQSVLMDAVYDASELIFIALILFLTPLFYKPISEKYPYGFFQVESIFLIVKGFMMLAVTVSVAIGIVQTALSGGNQVNEGSISLFQLVLGIVSVVIFLVMRRMNHALNSPTVKAELLGWKLDIGYSIGLSLAFFGAMFLNRTPLAFIAPYFDSLVAVAIMIIMLPQSVKMLLRAINDVFLFSPDENTVSEIKAIAAQVMEEHAFSPVFFDITRTGRHLWVAIYFEIAEDSLCVSDLKQATRLVNQQVGEAFENCTCELIPSAK